MFDLVWCCEVAEHVSESAIDFFVDTITNCRILALTAAPPGDGGHHHVNCQPVEYWIEKIEKSGMKIEVDKTNHMRSVAKSFGPRSDSHFMRNGMIFYREI
jgi:predicted 3-demethylubiquinone-9 3-methyltransferase (glyoxalase superfamily)